MGGVQRYRAAQGRSNAQHSGGRSTLERDESCDLRGLLGELPLHRQEHLTLERDRVLEQQHVLGGKVAPGRVESPCDLLARILERVPPRSPRCACSRSSGGSSLIRAQRPMSSARSSISLSWRLCSRTISPTATRPPARRARGAGSSRPTSRAGPRRLRAELRRDWARRRRGSRGPPARPRSLATYRAGHAPRPTP